MRRRAGYTTRAFGATIIAAAVSAAGAPGCGKAYDDAVVTPSSEGGVTHGEGGAGDAGPLPDGAGPGDGGTLLPECGAQRAVHLVGGNGGLAWFTLVWPLPAVIEGFQTSYAYDDPSVASLVTSTPDHKLYARSTGAVPALQGTGAHPHPTAIVTGPNETHSNMPTQSRLPNASEALAVGTIAQRALAPVVPAITISPVPFGPAPGVTAPSQVASVDAAITLLKGTPGVTASMIAELDPDPNVVTAWAGTGQPVKITELTRALVLAANAFRLGVLGTLVVPAFRDDPHGAFTTPDATTVSTALARVLHAFYTELAKSNEARCGHAGKPLSLADNTVLVVTGDTPKNPFDQTGWPDGTPSSSNIVYVRSNGFLTAGWFGAVTAGGGAVWMDPTTGSPTAGRTMADARNAFTAGLLFAISRGNTSFVSAQTSAPYIGLVAPSPP